MDFNAALDLVEGVDEAVEVAEAEPTSADFPLAEYGRRFARLRALMEDRGLDALVLATESNVRWVSGYDSMIWAAAASWLPGALVVTRDPAGALLVVSVFDAGAARGTAWTPVAPYADPGELVTTVVEHVRRTAGPGARVGVETALGSSIAMPFELARALVDALAPAADAFELLSAVRMLKSEAEIERLRTAAQSAVAGYRAGIDAARAGTTEEELLCRIGSTMYASGTTASTRPLFLNAVAGLARQPLADAPGSDRVLTAGDTVFIDGGGPTRGYMSDIIRIAGVGEVGPEVEAWMDAAVAANAAMRAAARAGISSSELYESGRAVYDEAGFGDGAGSLFGHGIGLEIWERPFVRRHEGPDEDVRLRPGMTLCLEPILAPVEDGVLRGLFVVEDMVAITDGAADVLSEGLDRELARIPLQ